MASEKENRTNEVKARLTSTEKAALRKKATLSGMSIANFIRAAIDGKEIINPGIGEELKSINNEINRIGVNLNQLVKLANTYSEIEAESLTGSIENFQGELKQLQKTVEDWVSNAN